LVLDLGEYIVRVDGMYGSDHIERLKFYTNQGRDFQFGSNSGTPFSAKAPAGKCLMRLAGSSDGYLNSIKFTWGPMPEGEKYVPGACSLMYGGSQGNPFDDTKISSGKVLRGLHLRAAGAIDGVQAQYGDPGDPSVTTEAPYHGGSGTDRYFTLEPGEHINRITGTTGPDKMHRLRFFTTRDRASEQFGSSSGNDWVVNAPEGMILHHLSGRSDGYLNAIKFYFSTPAVETFPPPGAISIQYGPPTTGNPWDDGKVARGKVLRTIHLRANTGIDGIQMQYGEPSDQAESLQCPYHGGSGTDRYFRLEPGEHIIRIDLTAGSDHIERLRFTTNRAGRQSEQFGSNRGTDHVVTPPEGYVLHHISGRSDGYLNAVRFYFWIPPTETFVPGGLGTVSMAGPPIGNAFDDSKAAEGKVLRTIHLRANTAVDGIQCIYGERGDPQDNIDLPYHGGSGTDRYFRLEPGEYIVKVSGRFGSDHIEHLSFTTNKNNRTEGFGTNNGTTFVHNAPAGKCLHYFSGRSDGYLNAVRSHWSDIPVETFAAGAVPSVSSTFGPTTGNAFDDTRAVGNEMVLKTVHLRSANAVDGIQGLYGRAGEDDDSVTAPYHGGSGTDRYFRLEPGEYIVKVDGMYGSDHIERLRFTTTRGRSEQFGSNTGMAFAATAPEGKVLHHFSGRSDGYLNAIRLHWHDKPDEKFAPQAQVPQYGPMTGTTFDDGKASSGLVLRTIHVRATVAVDGIQMLYGM
jgi:hypothetical protein